MPLTDQQAVQAVVRRASQTSLSRAKQDNDRQRFHAGPATSEVDAGPYATEFKKWVQGILLNEKKYARFCQLLRYPLPSSSLIDGASDQYQKCFGAEDRFRTMDFSDPALEADATEYLDTIHYDDFVQKTLFNQCLRAAAAIWVVDLPAEPNGEGYAQPRPYILEAERLTDIAVDTDGNVLYVAFPLKALTDDEGAEFADRWAVIDDQSYRVVVKQRDEGAEALIVLNNPHGLGRCPAGLIWHDRLTTAEPLRIQSPLHAELSRLDYYLASWVFRQHADLYASFPILWSYKQRCNYMDPDGNSCQNGVIILPTQTEDGARSRQPKTIPCPACSAAKPIGPGSHLEAPQPADNTSADLREPAGFINAERTLLDYNAEKVDALGREILQSLTGDNGEADQSLQAVNQDQVHARFESRKAVIDYWAENLEKTDADLLSVLLALRYGDQYLGSVVSYGTEFHLLSPGQAIADYDAARKAGLPTYQLMTRRERIDRLLAGASERTALRHQMLGQLEPYPDLSLNAVPAGSDAWELKANFSYYLSRFERDNGPVELFGAAQTMSLRIATITDSLYNYVTADANRRKQPEPANGNDTGGSRI